MIIIQFIKNSLTTAVFIFCISGITLLGGQWVLQEYFNDVNDNIVLASEHHREENKRIAEINNLLTQADSVQKLYVLWSPKVISIANSIPDGITLKNLSLNSSSGAFVFTGTADKRESLLQLQKNLSNLDFIDSIDIPLSELVAKENFTFSITATEKKYEN